jgi:hypothetical protein
VTFVHPAASEKSIAALKTSINEEKAKVRVAGNEKFALSEQAKALQAALATEEAKATDLGGKLEFYSSAYQKLQGKMTGVPTSMQLCCLARNQINVGTLHRAVWPVLLRCMCHCNNLKMPLAFRDFLWFVLQPPNSRSLP